MRQLYRLAAGGCADLVSRVPAIERPFVALGPYVWSLPGVGRLYRGVAERAADRLHRSDCRFRQVSICGVSLNFDVTEFTTRSLFFGRALYEPATTACLFDRLTPGRVFVDIGANHGYFTTLAAALVGEGGRVLAFEPNPAVFVQLEHHIELNGFQSHVVCEPVALADRPAAGVTLYVSQVDGNSGLSSLTPTRALLDSAGLSIDQTIAVQVDTFDRYQKAIGLEYVDLVKIDVERSEHQVVAGMSNALARNMIGAIICETTWDSLAHQLLCQAGFEPRILERAGPLANILYVKSCRTP